MRAHRSRPNSSKPLQEKQPVAGSSKAPGSPRRSLRLQRQNPTSSADNTQLSRPPAIEEHKLLPPTAPSRNPHIGGDGDGDERQPIPARLTRKNLALLNRMGKRKRPTTSGSRETMSTSSSGRSSSSMTSGFALQAYKNGILQPLYSKPPTNLTSIRSRGAASRETPSPTESMYEAFVDSVEGAVNEATMVFEVGGKLLKEHPRGYKRAFNKAFTGFPKDVSFNTGLSAPQPDFVEGLKLRDFFPFPVDEHVCGAVLYKDDPNSLALPHLAGEWKGNGRDMKTATLQSAYDGAALVYARNQALSWLGNPDPPGHAEVTTFTTDGTSLNLYAHYAAKAEDGTIEYHQYRIKSVDLVDSSQGLKDGRKWLRNEQDHARERAHALRDQLKEHWQHPPRDECKTEETGQTEQTDRG
ncbi:hypothetical protein CMQ_366 [Grosmannia clavigera kw1407]|uniref:DUF7924 domain-containing protein n=1 Tax=Grosmannia clavigera (strain kw1407 / UAMH 11150) TaxID=655863 RepID=F0XEN2_GROCL|nr:uncharacterized protein CMQ_366 [Grosmannia clavigera kw1407]EFX03438.1 hypothetical protein CMQ_366 [Grosmannia clavigera kw1407]